MKARNKFCLYVKISLPLRKFEIVVWQKEKDPKNSQ